jgi:hypothetical protein
MKIKLVHPLWTHLPSIAILVILVILVLTAGPLPAEAPVHFGFNGEPNRYGSPWEVFGITIGLSVIFILVSVLFDELWARQEKAKSFNWLSLMDDIFVPFMSGVSLGYLSFLKSGDASFSFPWVYALPIVGGAVVLAVILDMLRPYRPYPASTITEESPVLKEEITKSLKNKASFVYWDYQNPLYMSLVTVVLPLVMFLIAAITWFSQVWVGVVMLLVGIMMIVPYGGQRTLVTRDQVVIRWGILGIRVLRLKMENITGLSLHDFAPLKDFGGYGIRINREMTAYYLRGNRGVKITRTKGKAVLIGSDHPEELLSVLQGVTGLEY